METKSSFCASTAWRAVRGACETRSLARARTALRLAVLLASRLPSQCCMPVSHVGVVVVREKRRRLSSRFSFSVRGRCLSTPAASTAQRALHNGVRGYMWGPDLQTTAPPPSKRRCQVRGAEP
eukprot:525487-Prymnesium_polylepis.1